MPTKPRLFVLEIGTEELPPNDVANARQEVCFSVATKFFFASLMCFSTSSFIYIFQTSFTLFISICRCNKCMDLVVELLIDAYLSDWGIPIRGFAFAIFLSVTLESVKMSTKSVHKMS